MIGTLPTWTLVEAVGGNPRYNNGIKHHLQMEWAKRCHLIVLMEAPRTAVGLPVAPVAARHQEHLDPTYRTSSMHRWRQWYLQPSTWPPGPVNLMALSAEHSSAGSGLWRLWGAPTPLGPQRVRI